MTTALAVADVNKLGKLLSLALISDQDGEVLGALAALRRALTACGLGPHDLVDAFERGAQPFASPTTEDHFERDERSDAWFCFYRRNLLSPKERAFIENVVRRSAPLSAKQRKWIFDIADRLSAEVAA
jgi:hypothetical protein